MQYTYRCKLVQWWATHSPLLSTHLQQGVRPGSCARLRCRHFVVTSDGVAGAPVVAKGPLPVSHVP